MRIVRDVLAGAIIFSAVIVGAVYKDTNESYSNILQKRMLEKETMHYLDGGDLRLRDRRFPPKIYEC